MMTGVLHEWLGSEIANLLFHGLSGWLMMPTALGLLWLELKLLSRLFTEPVPVSPALSPIGLARAAQDARDQRDSSDSNRRNGKPVTSAAVKGPFTHS